MDTAALTSITPVILQEKPEIERFITSQRILAHSHIKNACKILFGKNSELQGLIDGYGVQIWLFEAEAELERMRLEWDDVIDNLLQAIQEIPTEHTPVYSSEVATLSQPQCYLCCTRPW